MTKDVANRTSRDIQHAGLDLLSPLASRSLFWRARYRAESPALRHIPMLFWITETVQPNVVVTLGMSDAVPHFAVCQAIEKLGLDSLCYGIDMVSGADEPGGNSGDETGGETGATEDILSFNEDNFSDFSHILRRRLNDPVNFLHGGKIDLLIVNCDASQALFDAMDSFWLPELSERAVIVFTRGGETPAYDNFVRRLCPDDRMFLLDAETRACVVLRGEAQPDRLQRLAGLKIGEPGYLSARTVFTRLGELHVKSFEYNDQRKQARAARSERDAKAAELEAAQASLAEAREEIATLQAQLKERSTLVATAQAEAFDLRQQAETRAGEAAEWQKAAAEAEAQCAGLRSERDSALDKVVALSKDLADLRQANKGRKAKLDAERSAMQIELAEAQAKAEMLRGALEEAAKAAEAERERAAAAERETMRLKELSSRQQEDLDERFADISALGLEMRKREETLEETGKKLEAARQEVDSLKKAVADAETERRTLKERAEKAEKDRDARIKDVEGLKQKLAEADELKKKLAAAEKDRDARIKEADELKKKLEESEKARKKHAERVSDLESSTSWRVTAPLRKVSSTLRGP